MKWTDRAACRGMDTMLFFPAEDERSPDRKKREVLAKAVCATCNVRPACLIAGKGEDGIWGGQTESERLGKVVKRKLSRPVVKRSESDANPWVAIDEEGGCQIWQRESDDSWHGVEWAVVRHDEIVYLSHNLDDTYAKYGNLIHS